MFVRIRHYIPNFLTFLSLSFGLTSMMMACQGNLTLAGYLIFGSFIMDALDGIIARKMETQSTLGMQLDSLADLSGLGIAPLVLLFNHLSSRGTVILWVIPSLNFTLWASAFRLARFNLLPPKSDIQKETIGLTLFHTGFMITVAVLSDLSFSSTVPVGVYAGVLLVLSLSMVCKLYFPPIPWFFSSRVKTIAISLCFIVGLIFLPLFTTLLLFSIAHLVFSGSRGLYLKIIKQTSAS